VPNIKTFNRSYYQNYCIDHNESLHSDRDHQTLAMGLPNVPKEIQNGLAVASIARDDQSTLPGDNPFPRARMHCDRNAQ